MASSTDDVAAGGPSQTSDPRLLLMTDQDETSPDGLHREVTASELASAPQPDDTNTSPPSPPAITPAEIAAEEKPAQEPPFILYKAGPEFGSAIDELATWVHGLLLPVYGREVTSMRPWCSRWWEHLEAVAQLYGLWMAWQEMTGSGSALIGPAAWHRDYLLPVMTSLRDQSGPFAGCKLGRHRDKEAPPFETP